MGSYIAKQDVLRRFGIHNGDATVAQQVARILGKVNVSSLKICFHAVLAQSVARRLGKAEVGGSSPLDSFVK